MLGMADNTPNHDDQYQYGALESEESSKKNGFFKTMLKTGRDSALKGIDVGNTAVREINETIRASQQAKYDAQVRAAEAEAQAKYGADSRDYDAAVAQAKAEALEQYNKELAASAENDSAGHTEEEWEWILAEDGQSGKWALKGTA